MLQTTRLSKVLAAVLLSLFLVEFFVPDTSNYLALVAGRTLPCVWNLVTCGLLTVNPVELVINIVSLLLLARVVEPVYGSKEFLKLVFVVDLVVASLVFVVVYIKFAVAEDEALLWTEFSGFHGVVAALLVAVKQIMPLHEIKLLGTLKLQVKYLPSLLLLFVAGVATALGRPDYLAFYATGTYVGWVYLRFFQQQPDSNLYGDSSDDFKFSSFFPPFLAPVIDPVAGLLGYVTRLRHVPGAAEAAAAARAALLAQPSALGTDAVDANRRRERGAKALEERLGLKSGGAAGGAAAAGGSTDDLEAATAPQGSPLKL